MAGTSSDGQRIQVTGRQPAQTAVAQAGFLLLLEQVVEVQAQFRHRLPGLFRDAEVEEIVGQMRAGQELGGEVGHHARVLPGVGFQRPHALLEHAVADGQRQGGVGVVARRGHRHAAEAAEQVVEERLLEVGDAQAGADTGGGRKFGRFGRRFLFRRRHQERFLLARRRENE